MRNRQITAALFAILLFAGGVTVGVLADRYYSVKVVHARPSTDSLRERYVDEMKSRLHLTPDQVSHLAVLLDQTRDKFKAFREEHRTEFDGIIQQQNTAVRGLLTPEQIPEYDKLLAEREKRRKGHQGP